MLAGFRFALYAKDELLRRRLDGKVGRVKVRFIRTGVEFMIARSVTRVLDLASIR